MRDSRDRAAWTSSSSTRARGVLLGRDEQIAQAGRAARRKRGHPVRVEREIRLGVERDDAEEDLARDPSADLAEPFAVLAHGGLAQDVEPQGGLSAPAV